MHVLSGISIDYQGTIRTVEAKASASGNAETSTVAFWAVKSLLMSRVIPANLFELREDGDVILTYHGLRLD